MPNTSKLVKHENLGIALNLEELGGGHFHYA